LEKLKIVDSTKHVINVQTLFIEFDTLYPTLPGSNVATINKAIRILNDTSPIINLVGQNNAIKGNDLAHAYNTRMKAVTTIGEKIAAKNKLNQ